MQGVLCDQYLNDYSFMPNVIVLIDRGMENNIILIKNMNLYAIIIPEISKMLKKLKTFHLQMGTIRVSGG